MTDFVTLYREASQQPKGKVMRNVGWELTRVQVATTVTAALIDDYRANDWKVLDGFPEVVVQDHGAYFLVSLKAEGFETGTLMLDRGAIRSQAALREHEGQATPEFISAVQDLVVELEGALRVRQEAVSND